MASPAQANDREEKIRQRYQLFSTIIGGQVPDHVIVEIASVEPPGVLRAAIDNKDRQGLQAMLQGHVVRAFSLVADVRLSGDQARHLMRTRGIGQMLAILENRDVPSLSQLATIAHLELQELADQRSQETAQSSPEIPKSDRPMGTNARLAPPSSSIADPQQGQGAANSHNVVDMPRPSRPPQAPPVGAAGLGVNRSRFANATSRSAAPAQRSGAHQDGNTAKDFDNPELNPVRVFNKPRAAALFEMTLWAGVPTLRIESAPGPHPEKPDQYHWDKKIIFNLTTDELPVLVATMLGLLPECTFSNHGPQNNKSMSMKYQEQNLYLTMNEGSESRNAVRIDVGPAYHATVLACEILMRATKAASWDVCYAAICRTVAPMQAKKLAGKPAQRRSASR
ncbi:MAG: hypothetical protein IPO08_24300 [Xanthomonadales bacterium]|nr:hypothetical protein [Xanthomonadales bacterium]